MVDDKKYVVLDVETNGLSSVKDDLLSISIYRPDNNSVYNKFLPLEKNWRIVTTDINGITKDDLRDATPLTQSEVDELVRDFELDKRIILTYGSIDYKFLNKYFKTHKLKGIDDWQFLNFKHNIISSRFETAELSKDNLCRFFGIRGVKKVHSGISDCKLEWKLFQKLDNQTYLVIKSRFYRFTDEYIVPASYLSTYYNFKYHKRIPTLDIEKELIKQIEMPEDLIKKYPTNFNGIILEQVIYSLLNAEEQDNTEFLISNKAHLRCLGWLPGKEEEEIEVSFNKDGTINVYNREYENLETELNVYIRDLKESVSQLTDYLKENILLDEKILSQEMVVNKEDKVLALCDLSTTKTVIELKTYMNDDWNEYKIQLYYQSRGRDIYVVTTNWESYYYRDHIIFEIYKVRITEVDKGKIKESVDKARFEEARNKAQMDFEKNNLELVEYAGPHAQATLRCKKCNFKFTRVVGYSKTNSGIVCPFCGKKPLSQRERKKKTKESTIDIQIEEQSPKKQKNISNKSMSLDERYEKKLAKWAQMRAQKEQEEQKD